MYSSAFPLSCCLLLVAAVHGAPPVQYPQGVPVPGVPPITKEVAIEAGGPLPTGDLPPSFSDNAYDHLKLAVYLENLESYYFNHVWRSLPAGTFTDKETTALADIGAQEKIHVSTVELVLSVFNHSTVVPCTYKFPVHDKADFLGLGNLITSIGFGAAIHLGIDLALSDPALVAVVGQTVTVEARHDAFFRLSAGLTPSPSPYDTAIPGAWAFNWFNQYADSNTWPIFPALHVEPRTKPSLAQLSSGRQTFTWDQKGVAENPLYDCEAPLYIGWNNRLDNVVFTKVKLEHKGKGSAEIPEGLSGIVIAVLTHNNTEQLPGGLTPFVLAGVVPLTVS